MKADISSVSPSSEQIHLRSGEGLTLETSAFNFFMVANLPYQLRCKKQSFVLPITLLLLYCNQYHDIS